MKKREEITDDPFVAGSLWRVVTRHFYTEGEGRRVPEGSVLLFTGKTRQTDSAIDLLRHQSEAELPDGSLCWVAVDWYKTRMERVA